MQFVPEKAREFELTEANSGEPQTEGLDAYGKVSASHLDAHGFRIKATQNRNVILQEGLGRKGNYKQAGIIMAHSPEAVRTANRNTRETVGVTPAEDIRTVVVNQVSWGAVFAGAAIALVMQLILNMIGVGVGLSTMDIAQGDTPSAGSLSIGAGIWWVVSGIIAAALGGYIAGRLSGKASESTTAYHGLISWAVATLAVMYLLSSAASGLMGGAVNTASSVLGGAGKAIGGSLQTAVQTAAPSLNNVSDPMAAIENKVRNAAGGQDPAALRDAAATAVRAALSGDAAKQAEANDKAAEALAKAQNISADKS